MKSFDVGFLRAALALAAFLPFGAHAQSGTWTNLLGGSWQTAANWNGGVPAAGADATADFSTLDIAANRAVTLDGNVTVGSLLFTDTAVSYFNWTLNPGTPAGILTLDVSAGAPVINVTTATTTIAAQIAGTDGLTKQGRGTLALTVSNAYSGTTRIESGTLQAYHDYALGGDAGAVELAPGASTGYAYLQLNAGRVISNKTLVLSGYDNNNRAVLRSSGATWVGDVVIASGNNLNLLQTDSGTFRLYGNITNNGTAGGGIQFRGGGSGEIHGDINLTAGIAKNDGGTWTLYGTNNSWTSFQLAQGILRMGAANVCVPSVPVVYSTDKTVLTLDLNGFDQTVRGISAGTIYSGKVVSATAATLTIDTLGSTYTSLAAIQGAIALVKAGAGVQALQNTNTWTGATILSNGTLRILRADVLPDATDVTLAGGWLDLQSQNDTVGSLTFAAAAGGLTNATAAGKALSLASAATALAWTIDRSVTANVALVAADASRVAVGGYSGGAASLDGILNLGTASRVFDIADVNAAGADLVLRAQVSGSGGILKTGAGSLTISGVLGHSGATVVSNGMLILTGPATPTNSPTIEVAAGAALDASGLDATMTLRSGQMLRGSGTFQGGLIVESGATVAPGSSPGILTMEDDLTLNAGSTLSVELTGLAAGSEYDQLSFLGADDTLTLNSPVLALTDSAPFAPSSVFTIVTGFAALGGDGAFSGLADGATVTTANNAYEISYNPTSVTLTVIPEPGTLGMVGVVGLLMVLRRHGRR